MLSVAVVELFTGFRRAMSGTCWTFRVSVTSERCPLACTRALPEGSVDLPLETMGEECLLDIFDVAVLSEFPFTETVEPGRDLPAETGLSGKVVLRFGGVSRGKSGGTTG